MQLSAFRLLFIYNGPEFGDPNEIAKVTLTTPGGDLIGKFVVGNDDNKGYWTLGANPTVEINGTCPQVGSQNSTTTGSGAGCFDIDLQAIVTAVKFEALSAPGWTGSNNSDYDLGTISYEKLGQNITAVPEPASMLLLGTGLVACWRGEGCAEAEGRGLSARPCAEQRVRV